MNIYLETKRMILRDFIPEDADLLVDLDSDPMVMKFINGGKPTPKDYVVETVMPRLMSYYENTDGLGLWAALLKPDLEFMGWFLFRPFRADPVQTELGYRFKQKYWSQGFATEGSQALIKKGFEALGVTKVVAIADPGNLGSTRVMEKVGLSFDGEHREPDGFVCVKYSLDKSGYQKNAKLSK